MQAEVIYLVPQTRHQSQAREITPEVAERVGKVASDWLWELCGHEGRVKLLEQHEALAA